MHFFYVHNITHYFVLFTSLFMHFDLFFLYNIGVLSFQQALSCFFTLPYFCFCRPTF